MNALAPSQSFYSNAPGDGKPIVVIILVLALLGVATLSGCGGLSTSTGPLGSQLEAGFKQPLRNRPAHAVAITVQPTSQTVTTGQTATFSVASSGAAPIRHQWKKNSISINGATSATYTTPATTASDNGEQFTVTVSNSTSKVTSKVATLTVSTAPLAPSIITQPVSQTGTAGQTATFAVTASGTTPLSYQWAKNGRPISAATSSSYTTPPERTSDSGTQFTVVVTNSAGSVTSRAAILTVNTAPVAIKVNPSNVTMMTGSTQQFSASVTGTSNTAVIWSVSGAGCSSGAACGTISPGGLYTSPASVSSSSTITVKATTVADPTKSASASVTFVAAVAVLLSISPTSASVPTDGTQSLIATVTGNSNTAVTWSLSGAGCSGSSCGTLSTSPRSAVYAAPFVAPSPASVNVVATSIADPIKSASAKVTIVPTAVVTVAPANVSVPPGTTQQFNAAVTGTSNTVVAWTVSGAGCSGAACGTLDSSGRYTAPSVVPSPGTVTVTATSIADPTKSGSASVTLDVIPATHVQGHPRIWITPSKLAQLQGQYRSDANYAAMKASINQYMASPYGTAGADCTSVPDAEAYDMDIAWAMVYQVEGIARYGDCAVKMGEQAMAFFCPGGAYGNASACYQQLNSYRAYIIHAVIIFDWAYARLAAGDKTTFVKNLTSAFAWQKNNNTRCYNQSDETYCRNGGEGVMGNLAAGQIAGDCFIGYGTWGDNPSDSGQSNNQIAQCLQRYANEFHPTWNSAATLPPNHTTGAGLGVGGTYIEGAEYGPQTYEYVLTMLLAMTTATGTDYFADNGTIVQDIVLSTIHMTSPNSSTKFGCGPSDSSYFPTAFGDEQPPVGIMQDSSRPVLGLASDYLGASNIYAQYANFWLNNIQPADQCSATHYGARRFYNFFFNTTGKTATDWRTGSPIDTDRKAAGMQMISSRSDWTANGSWVGYLAGSINNDHTRPSVGSFHYWRKGEMLTQSDIYYINNDFGCGEHENNVMINGKSQIVNAFNISLGEPLLNYYEGGATYMYAQSDAYQVYRGITAWGLTYNSATQVLRDFIYLKPDYIITWDRLALSPSTTNKILIHGPWGATPTSAGQAITVATGVAKAQTTGGQWLYITPLAPSSPSFTVVDEATAYSCIGNGTTYNVPANSFTTKRVEVSSGTSDSAMQYLTFVEGSDSLTPVAAEKLTSGNLIAVHAKNLTDDKVIGFSSSPSGGVITLPVSYSFTATASTDTHLIANLAPNSTVNVTRSKVGGTVSVTLASSGAGTNYTTTSAGVLCFTSGGTSCAGLNAPAGLPPAAMN